MRGLMRNKRTVVYKNYVSTSYAEDESGHKTGKKPVTYSDPKSMYCTVSTPTGNTILEMFGTNENYDKVVVVDKPDMDIDENSILWIDRAYGENVTYDYIVKKIVRNHNFLTIGVRKVNVK